MRRAKLFVFLRKHRHMLFNEAFQQELASLYDDSVRGRPPISPALLALVTILQAYMGVSDDEVLEAILMDRRWELLFVCLGTDEGLFCKGTVFAFPQGLLPGQKDRRVL